MPAGIPDRSVLGDPQTVRPGQLLDWVVQHHLAQRAGPHFDIRFGGPETGLYSWASRKGLPAPGERRLLVQQPIHSHGYKDFEGKIDAGYGAGEVRRSDLGQLLITDVGPNTISFTLAHQRYPERFTLIRPRDDSKDWLLANTTPTTPVPYVKQRYVKIPREKIDSVLGGLSADTTTQAKIDGASSLVKLLKDGVELVSYRSSAVTGRPILHTERVFRGRPKFPIDPKYVGSILRGELFGTRDGKTIHPSELGGLLNSTLANSFAQQDAKGIKLREGLFDIQQLGKTPVTTEMPFEQRQQLLKEILPALPAETFELLPGVKGPEAAQQLWQQISSGRHPLTEEGVVIHPPTGRPMKAKVGDEHDVIVDSVFPGGGKYTDTGAGGFSYRLIPGGPVIGRVGTGFSDELRKELLANSTDYAGRVARIRAQEQLPSGAFRAPGFIAFHEDYPVALPEHVKTALAAAIEKWATDPAPPISTSILLRQKLGLPSPFPQQTGKGKSIHSDPINTFGMSGLGTGGSIAPGKPGPNSPKTAL